MEKKLPILLVILCLGVSFFVPAFLGTYIVPLGTGPDEIAHIDRSFFSLSHPNQIIDTKKGLLAPGHAPVCQGHQPPLSYALNSQILRFFHDPSEVGAFIDSQAGIEYSSDGGFLGGANRCSYREKQLASDSNQGRFKLSIRALRVFSSLLLVLGGLAAFLLGIFASPSQVLKSRLLLGLISACLYLSIPNAIWRSIFVSNDNLVSCLGAWGILASVMMLRTKGQAASFWFILSTVLSALAFLAKYTGIPLEISLLIAVLLQPTWRGGKKAANIVLSLVLFLGLVSSDLLENYFVDGDIFSGDVIQHLAHFLYIPSSFWEVATNTTFLRTLGERIWIEFHDFGHRSLYFPHFIIYLWWVILLGGVVGSFLLLISSRTSEVDRKEVTLYFSASILSLVAILFFATKFPLPAGRYFHPVLLALIMLILCGWNHLLKFFLLVEVVRYKYLLVAVSLLFVLGQGITFGFQVLKYKDCFHESKFNVPGGAVLLPVKSEEGETDKIALFHRIRNRLFHLVPKNENSPNPIWELAPQMTRYVGLVADKPLSLDLNGDKKNEILFWRPGAQKLIAVDGKYFLMHDKKASVYSDLATRQAEVAIPGLDTDEVFTCSRTEIHPPLILFHQPATRLWKAYSLSMPSRTKLSIEEYLSLKLGETYELSRVHDSLSGCILSAHDPQGNILLTASLEKTLLPGESPTVEKHFLSGLSTPAVDDYAILTLGKGLGFVGLKSGESCLALMPFGDGIVGDRTAVQRLCNDIFSYSYNQSQVSPLQVKGSENLAVFSQISGQIQIWGFVNQDSGMFALRLISEVNPGWIKEEGHR